MPCGDPPHGFPRKGSLTTSCPWGLNMELDFFLSRGEPIKTIQHVETVFTKTFPRPSLILPTVVLCPF